MVCFFDLKKSRKVKHFFTSIFVIILTIIKHYSQMSCNCQPQTSLRFTEKQTYLTETIRGSSYAMALEKYEGMLETVSRYQWMDAMNKNYYIEHTSK